MPASITQKNVRPFELTQTFFVEDRPIRRRLPALLLIAPPLAFLALFYFYPLLSLFDLSFFADGQFQLERLSGLISSDYYLHTLWFTSWQALASTGLTLFFGLPAAFVLSQYEFPGRRLLRVISGIPFVLPTIVVATAFHALLGPSGLLNTFLMRSFQLQTAPIALDHSIWAILLAHVFYNMTVVIRIVGGFWSTLDPTLVQAARILGASPWQAFRKITLPLLLPAILTSALLVFIFCFCSFGVILILGGPRFATLEVAIYRQAVHIFNLPLAAALSLIQIAFTFVLMWAYTSLQRKASVRMLSLGRRKPRPCKRGMERLAVATASFVLSCFSGLPLTALVLQSLHTAHGLSLRYYTHLFTDSDHSIFFVPPRAAIENSLLFGAATMLLALCLGFCAAKALSQRNAGKLAGFLDPLFMLPLSTSAVTLGFGFIIALDTPPLDLRSSILLVPLAHSLVAFPFVVRTLLPALRSIPQNTKEAATMLGASPFQVWRHIEVPVLSSALVAAAVFAFTISLGEFGATVFVARPQTPTLPLAVYRFLGQPGALNYGQAMAMSSLLMLVTALSFLALEKATPRDWGEF